MKTMDFSGPICIAACDLEVGTCRCRQLNVIELMKLCEYWRSRTFLDLGLVIYISKLKLAFLRNHWAILNQVLYVSF